MIKKTLNLPLFFSLFFCSSLVYSAELIRGDDGAASGESFSFSIGEYVLHSSGRSFYVAAYPDAIDSKEFAVSKLDRRLDHFIPLVYKNFEIKKEKSCTCEEGCDICKSKNVDAQKNNQTNKFDTDKNKKSDQKETKSKQITKTIATEQIENPLYDKGIKLLGLLESGEKGSDYPIVVTKDEKNILYLIDQSSSRRIPVISCDNILDATNPVSAKIGNIVSVVGGLDGNIFAAVTKNGSDVFGDPGSGIAHLRLSFSKENVPMGDGSGQMKEETHKSLKQVGKAISLDKTSDVVKINTDLGVAEVTDMYWDSYLGCLYIALHVKAGAGATDGAKALVMGKFKNIQVGQGDKKQIVKVFVLKSIANNLVFSGTNEIVAGVGADTEVSLHKVRTMISSNMLPYVVVLGGNSSSVDTKKSVFAMPLVKDPSDEEYHGTLAAKDALPEDLFEGCNVKSLKYRYVKQRATESEDLFTSDDIPANDPVKVGGGPLSNDISDIFVYSDAVYAVSKSGTDYETGIFMSHALFDENGKIKRWTKWQKVLNTEEEIFGGSLDAAFGNFITLEGLAENDVRTVRRTFWGDGDNTGLANLSEILSEEFPKCIAGIQGLFEFPYPEVLKNIGLLVATGLQKIALVELGYEALPSEIFIRNTGNFSTGMKKYKEGKITDTFPVGDTKVIVISGGVLDQVGPIVASEISFSNNTGRLFVGGIGGVAVLVDKNGDGWDSTAGLGPNFEGLTDTMAFKPVGNFRFVRKIIAEGNLLFVLTDRGLYRINIGNSDFVTGIFDIVQIASSEDLIGLSKRGTLLDFVLSEKLGVLGTSLGLYRVGDGKDVRSNVELNWTKVKVPAYFGPVKQLFPISASLLPNDFAKNGLNGMLYVLGADPGKNKAQLNRFSIQAGGVDSSTILPLPDFFLAKPCKCEDSSCKCEGSYSYFVHFGTYRKLYEEDGGLKFHARDRDLACYPFVELLPPGLMSGSVFPIIKSRFIPLAVENDCDIIRVLKSFTGPVFIAGSFGLKINE